MKPWLPPLILVIISFGVFAASARQHPIGTYWTETDFYQYYGPDAERIAAWRFPENPYQGPGYPAAVAIAAKFTGDVFVAGKWISVVSATIVVALAFMLFARLFGYWTGLAAASLVPVSAQFAQFAISAATDAFFLMLCLACLVVLTDDRASVPFRVISAGVLAGLAYLVRYNGIFLIAVGLFAILILNIFVLEWRARAMLSMFFLAAFLLIASPWLYANYRHRGSPFYNANYLNIATEFYPELAEGRTNQDGTRELEKTFGSFGDVLRYDPQRLLRHYPANLYESFVETIRSDLVSRWTGLAALVGLLIVLVERRSKTSLLLLAAAGLYFLLMGLNHWETRYYFFVMVVYSGLAAYACVRVFEWVRERGMVTSRAFVLAPLALIAVMWGSSFAMARTDLTAFLEMHPTEILAACDYLRGQGVSGAQIVARKPHVPFICHQEWVFFPSVKSLDELREWLTTHRADYLVISSVELKRRRELSPLKNPETAPPWLKVVWASKDPLLILYRPQVTEP